MKARRSFLKGFGLLGAVVAGASAPIVVEAKQPTPEPTGLPKIDKDIVAILEEQAPPTLSLQATYGEVAPPPPPPTFTDGYIVTGGNMGIGSSQERLRLCADGSTMMLFNQKKFVPGSEKQHTVAMVPGPDGELYLKIGDTWKRVLTTEG